MMWMIIRRNWILIIDMSISDWCSLTKVPSNWTAASESAVPQPHQKCSRIFCADKKDKRWHTWCLSCPVGKRGTWNHPLKLPIKISREQFTQAVCCINNVYWQGNTDCPGWATSPGRLVVLKTNQKIGQVSSTARNPLQNMYPHLTLWFSYDEYFYQHKWVSITLAQPP